jgi:glyoxylase-like metal-dependent hydrolase (beta-lactamase superfamily II)
MMKPDSAHAFQTDTLRTGSFSLDGGGMFGIIPQALWSNWVERDEANRVALQCNAILLQDGDRRILIEAGYGEKWNRKDRGIFVMENRTAVDALSEHGIEPDQITDVILTHLHFDHAGGITRWTDPTRGDEGGFEPTFPNARIIVQAREWEDALANRSTMTRTYLESHLRPIADRIVTVDGASEVLPGVTVHPVPGHTWGQQAIEWTDGTNDFIFPGDVCPTRAHVHPSASTAYDVEPWTNMNTKKAVLDRCREEGRLLVLGHDPGPAIVRCTADPEGRRGHVLESVEST